MQKYKDYRNLIFKLAHRYHRHSGIEFEELVGWGNLEFIECQNSFDPALSSFSTHLYIRLVGLFLELSRREWQKKNYVYSNSIKTKYEPVENCNPEDQLLFKEILMGLSNDAKEVVKIVFDTPLDLVNIATELKQPKGINKQQIRKYLRTQNWSLHKIYESFKEITKSLS